MPNPLLFAQASQMGLDYGQDIVSGVIDSAQGAANVVSTVQDIGLKPQKLEIEKQKVNQEQQRIGLEERRTTVDEQAEERLLAQQGIDQGFKEQELDIKRDRLKRVGLSQGIAAQKRADKEMFDGLASDFILDRDVNGVMGSLGDVSTQAGRRRQAKFLNQLLDDKELAQGFVNTAEDSLANDNLNATQRKFLEDQVKYLGMHSKVKAQAELAEIGSSVLRTQLGVNVEKGERLDWRRDPSSNEIHIRSKKPGQEKWRMLGTYAPGTEKERNDLFSGMAAINRLDDIESDNRNEVRKSIEATVDKKGLRIPGEGAGANQERPTKQDPTKDGPTPTMRRGLQRGAPDQNDERRAIEETRSQMSKRPLSDAQKQARRRARQVAGLEEESGSVSTTQIPRPGRSERVQ